MAYEVLIEYGESEFAILAILLPLRLLLGIKMRVKADDLQA